MNIILTGGAGYIGSVTLRILREAGHSVIVVDNLSHGYRDSIPDDVEFFEGRIGDIDTLLPAEMPIDAVVHLAALISAGESMSEAPRYWQNNVVETSQLLLALRKRNVKKLVFASTAAVYGNPSTVPILEDASKIPTNVYGATKLAIDTAITIEAETYGLGATSLRFFNVAGAYGDAGERHPTETHLIPLAIAAAAGHRPGLQLYGTDYPTPDGTCIRDYIHVADLADAIVLALEQTTAGTHSIYNLGNGTGFSNRQVLHAVEAVTGRTVPVEDAPRRAGDPSILVASSARAHEQLGWKPKRPDLEVIVRDAWEFYQTLQHTPTT